MIKPISLLCFFVSFSVLSVTAKAADFALSIMVPTLNVSEYHRPYIAVWVEDKQRKVVKHVTVWHEHKSESDKWLKDLRLWWRRGGRNEIMPSDAFSGATKPPGTYPVNWQLNDLPEGEYVVYVEAAREVGGREKIKLPFSYPITAPVAVEKMGKTELNQIKLTIQ